MDWWLHWPRDKSVGDLGPGLFIVLDHRESTVSSPQQHLSQLGDVLLAVDYVRWRSHDVTRSTQLHVDPEHKYIYFFINLLIYIVVHNYSNYNVFIRLIILTQCDYFTLYNNRAKFAE